MNHGDKTKCIIVLNTLKKYKNDWCIGRATVSECKTNDLPINESIRIKGCFPWLVVGNTYEAVLEMNEDPKWGIDYRVISIYSSIAFDEKDKKGQEKFLRSIFTEGQVDALYEALPDPYTALLNGNAYELVQVKGVGMKMAETYMRKFKNNLNKAKIYTELESYNLTEGIIQKLISKYGAPELIISKIKENPYILCNEVKGIGWKTADKIACDGGIDRHSKLRVKAYIYMYLETSAENGNSWITPDELLGAILDNLGDDIPDEPIKEALSDLIEDGLIWHDDKKTKLGLKKYYDIELKLAKELIRLRNAKSRITYGDWESILKDMEHRQGWEFTEEQMIGIKTGLDNNISIITGPGGTGKTSIVSGILRVLDGYSYITCALAGRAAANMQEITGKEGKTIHSLLGYSPKGEKLYEYDEENQLEYDIYIVDEISMVDARLLYNLLRAIPNGSKIFFLGDTSQLESIGAGNVAHDMINSNEIAVSFLTKIHRQAQKSAIITESIKVRNGIQLVDKDWTGKETRGELRDLNINCFSDATNTFYEVMKYFSADMNEKDFDIMNTQVIVPMKTRGASCTYELNNAIQELYNPESENKREETNYISGNVYILREGDKVINRVNNYSIKPNIFNGNIGILKSIYEDEEENTFMIVDFLGIGEVILNKDAWKNIEPAYALTVHSLQGSAFNHVIIGIDFSSFALLTRELVYTAITRAKKKCDLIVQGNALRYAISKVNVTNKQTHLKDCLYEIAHPKLIF